MDLYDGSGHAPLGSNGQVELLYTCKNVNKTEQKLLLLEYCDSLEWMNIKTGSGFPDQSNRENSTFDNVFIFCEHVNTPIFNVMSITMTWMTIVSIVLLMMGVGVTMEPPKIIKFAKRPVGATVATVIQFGIMPFIAYGLAIAFGMDEVKTLTLVILGSAPGGSLSNFMALLLRGDMNLSILMTSASTIVGVVAIPGVIKLLSGMFLNPCTDLQVDPMTIIKPLGLTLIPVIVGMAIKNWSTEKVCDVVLMIGKIGMVGGLVGIIATNVAIYRSSLVTRFPVDVLLSLSLLPVTGFAIGYVAATAVREPPRSRRTIMLETGLKNAQVCLAIMLVTFENDKVGVLMMVPIYLLAFQVAESAILAGLFTKLLQCQSAESQIKTLQYPPGMERHNGQRRYSRQIAAMTHTPFGADGSGRRFSLKHIHPSLSGTLHPALNQLPASIYDEMVNPAYVHPAVISRRNSTVLFPIEEIATEASSCVYCTKPLCLQHSVTSCHACYQELSNKVNLHLPMHDRNYDIDDLVKIDPQSD